MLDDVPGTVSSSCQSTEGAPARFCFEAFCPCAPAALRPFAECSRPSQNVQLPPAASRRHRSRSEVLSRVHLFQCTNLTCCPMVHLPQQATARTEELSAGRPTCSTCNVVHCNTKSTVSSSRGASSCIHGSWILHSSAFIHDPGLSSRTPLPCKILGSPEPDYRTVLRCMAALLSHWLLFSPWRLVSSGLACPAHRLESPRALRPMSCRANPSRSCHHHRGTAPFAAWRRAASASRATCRQHMRACPLLDLAYGRTPVRPAAEAPRASCSDAAVCGYRVRPGPTVPIICTVLLTFIVRVPCTVFDTSSPRWILLTIVINSQERSRDTEPERPTLSGPRAGPVLPTAPWTVQTMLCWRFCTLGLYIRVYSWTNPVGAGVSRASPLGVQAHGALSDSGSVVVASHLLRGVSRLLPASTRTLLPDRQVAPATTTNADRRWYSNVKNSGRSSRLPKIGPGCELNARTTSDIRTDKGNLAAPLVLCRTGESSSSLRSPFIGRWSKIITHHQDRRTFQHTQ